MLIPLDGMNPFSSVSEWRNSSGTVHSKLEYTYFPTEYFEIWFISLAFMLIYLWRKSLYEQLNVFPVNAIKCIIWLI
jgi:hypothetical protein